MLLRTIPVTFPGPPFVPLRRTLSILIALLLPYLTKSLQPIPRLKDTLLLFATSLLGLLLTAGSVVAQETPDSVLIDAEQVAAPSAEYDGGLPPLINRQVFFGDPKRFGAQISPDGNKISFLKPYKGVMNVWVKEVGQPFDTAEPVTADTTRPVPDYFWTQDSEQILYQQDKGGNENYHIYAVDPDAEKETDLGVPPAEDLTPYENVRARIFAVPEATPNEIVVGLNDRNPKFHDLYRVDLDTGERSLIFRNTEGYGSYTFDHDGQFRLASRQTDSGGTDIQRVDIAEDDTSFTTIYSCSVDESCGAYRFHKDNERVYVQTNKGDDIDLQRLILLNVETEESEVVASDPEEEVDFGGAIFNDRTEELAATVYVGERQRVYPQTKNFEQMYETLKKKLPDGNVSLQSSTEDFQTHLVSVEQDVNPGATYRFDGEGGTVKKLYESRPGFSTTLRVFSPRKQKVRTAQFDVTGTKSVEIAGKSYETYAVDVDIGDGTVTGTWYLRQKAPHYLVKSSVERSTARGTQEITLTLSSMETRSASGAQAK